MAGIPQVITEDRASGAQFIDGSLKFEQAHKKHLIRTPGSLGNQKTWTLSFWFKKQNMGDQRVLFNSFTDNSNRVIVRFMSDKLQFALQTGGTFYGLQTNQVFRDNGWYHVVLLLDTTQAKDIDRQKIYVNGNQIADADLTHNSISGSNKYPTQNSTFNFNTNVAHYIGANNESNSVQNTTFDGQITNVNLVDGLGLGPEYFGFTDPLTDVWRPKKFRAEGTTVNNGTNWSGSVSNAANSAINLFDGSTSTYTEGSTDGTLVTWSGNVSGSKIEFYAVQNGTTRTFTVEGVDRLSLVPTSSTNAGWFTIPGLTTLTNFSFSRGGGGHYVDVFAIRVDGVIMTNNTTQNLQFGANGFYLPMDGNSPIGEDKSGAPSPNDGTVWSSYFTGNHDSTHGWSNLYESANVFDGDLSSAAIGQVSATGLTWTAPGGAIGADATTIRIYGNDDACPDDYLKINGINYGSLITQGFGPDWTVLKGPGAVGGGITQLESVYLRDNSSGNTHYRWRALEIDGVVLVDGVRGNDWKPVNFGGSVTLDNPTVSGAIPIHNTNDAGTVAKRGVRTDSKTYTVTASGGNYYLDGALKPTLNAYRGGTYTFDYTGATSHPFYLSSLSDGKWNSKAYSVEFDGSNQYLTHPNDDTITDWSTGNYTIELWAYFDSFTVGANSNTHLIGAAAIDSGSESWSLGPNSSGQVVWYYWNGSQQRVTGGTITTGKWYHLAMTHSAGLIKIFIDGKLSTTGSVNGTPQTSTLPLRIGKITNSSSFDGYVSNVRIVRGSAVYTSNFTPPGTTLTNITNTTFLACQDSDATTAPVAPGTITATGAAASQSKQPFLYDNNHGNFGVNTATSNTTKITIPHLSADTLYYYCNAHSGMGSSINVTTDIRKADPYAWKCFLACPYAGDEFDVSDQINCNSTKTAATNWNSVQGSNGATFYNSGRYFAAGGSKNINYAGKEEFNFTGDYKAFTIEFFATPSSGSSDGAPISSKGYYSNYGNWYLRLATTNGGRMNFYSYDGQSNGQNNEFQNLGCTDPNRVHHVVVQRDENNLMTFILDGVIVGQASNVTRNLDDGLQSGLTVGRIPSNNSTNSAHNWYLGYISDLRIYSGLAKYSGSVGDHVFTPPSVTPDVLPDTPSGIVGKTKLTKITDGAVAFDGNGDSLVCADSPDWDFGTGDFTIECFAYFNDTTSNNSTMINRWTDIWTLQIVSSTQNLRFYAGASDNLATANNTIGPNKWYHFAASRSSGTLKLFINGVESASSSFTKSLSGSVPLNIGAENHTQSLPTDGFISNVRIVNGTALYTSSFTPPTEPLTNVTNTVLLCCQSNTSATEAAVIPAVSFTTNGDAAATNFNPFTDDINTTRGQETSYATMNPLSNRTQVSVSKGNLFVEVTSGLNSWEERKAFSTIGVNSGKWYAEMTLHSNSSSYIAICGNTENINETASIGWQTQGWGYYSGGILVYQSNELSGNPTYGAGDTVAVALDVDNSKVKFYKNGIQVGNSAGMTITPGLTWFFAFDTYDGTSATWNFGQNPFKFPPPDGFRPLSLSNTQPEKVIAHPDQHVGTTLYTGNNTVGREIDLGRKFDLVWVKKRNAAENHILVDTVRGANNFLMSDTNNQANTSGGPITALNDTSIVVDNNGYVNSNNDTYVAWSWRAGGSKNTFNIDDVGYANASDVNMSVGALNSTVYNSDQTWSTYGTQSGTQYTHPSAGTYVWADVFDNISDSPQQVGTCVYGPNQKWTFTNPVSVSSSVALAVWGLGTVTLNAGESDAVTLTSAGNTYNTISTTSLAGATLKNIQLDVGTAVYLFSVHIDGARLVDPNIAPDAPSVAATGCSVGTKQGFSIIKYQGGGGSKTVPHGLTQPPDLLIVKQLNNAGTESWHVMHSALGATHRGKLDTNAAFGETDDGFGNVNPTSKVFTVAYNGTNKSGSDYIAYCWHDVPGLQKFGSYTNPNSSVGGYVELGFKPAILIYKCSKNLTSSSGSGDWMIIDTTRSPGNNPSDMNNLSANVNNSEDGYYAASQGAVDILSNGFKIRHPNSSPGGDPGRLYTYAAWAEAPAMNLYGGQSNAR